MKPMTVAEFDKQWKKAKKGLSPDTIVRISVPYADGIGCHYETPANVHSHGGEVCIAATYDNKNETERMEAVHAINRKRESEKERAAEEKHEQAVNTFATNRLQQIFERRREKQ